MTENLCDRFTKSGGKRGKPAKKSQCAVCEITWEEHFNLEKFPEREQYSVLHHEHVRQVEVLPPRPEINPDATGVCCDRFTTLKVGKPGKTTSCAVCETIWAYHFSEKYPNKGDMRPVLHPEHVRVIAEPRSKRRRPRAIAAGSQATSLLSPITTASEEEPWDAEAPDLMRCGHPITALLTVDGEEGCQPCLRVKRLWLVMKARWCCQKAEECPELTTEEVTQAHELACW